MVQERILAACGKSELHHPRLPEEEEGFVDLQRSCRGENNYTVDDFSRCENSRACVFGFQYLLLIFVLACIAFMD